MVIDAHTHPIVIESICENESELEFRRAEFGLYKASPIPMELILDQMEDAKIDKSVILPLDLTTTHGGHIVTNQEIKRLVEDAPQHLIGFASVDPHDTNASVLLDHAFNRLGLAGLKLNPSKQRFYPSEDIYEPIYRKCEEYGKPILFHAGMSWEPDALAEYTRPIQFEKLAASHPDLHICLAHFGWPWIYETVMLLLKYPNVYTDTSLAFMDSPSEFIKHVFVEQMGSCWIDRNISRKVIFGSNNPRFRPDKMKQAIEKLPLRDSTIENILGFNFERFMGWRD